VFVLEEDTVAVQTELASIETEFSVEGGALAGDALEIIQQTVNHPLLTTPFQDYTVTEGLLLLLLLCFFIRICMNMVRRAFSWLLS